MTDFTVTKIWINKHRTPKGAWTKAQLSNLGIRWPPVKGWANRLEGAQISIKSKVGFEEGRLSGGS